MELVGAAQGLAAERPEHVLDRPTDHMVPVFQMLYLYPAYDIAVYFVARPLGLPWRRWKMGCPARDRGRANRCHHLVKLWSV